jgi:hypothetical protein
MEPGDEELRRTIAAFVGSLNQLLVYARSGVNGEEHAKLEVDGGFVFCLARDTQARSPQRSISLHAVTVKAHFEPSKAEEWVRDCKALVLAGRKALGPGTCIGVVSLGASRAMVAAAIRLTCRSAGDRGESSRAGSEHQASGSGSAVRRQACS